LQPGVAEIHLTAAQALRLEVEGLLYEEAALLDAWQLKEWLALLTDDVRYEIPATDQITGDLATELGFVRDDRNRVEARVDRLLSRRAHREFPWSRTRRLITNVRATEDPQGIEAHANFCVWRFRSGQGDCFVGSYDYLLRRTDDGLKISYKRANLDLERLHPHGTVSILL